MEFPLRRTRLPSTSSFRSPLASFPSKGGDQVRPASFETEKVPFPLEIRMLPSASSAKLAALPIPSTRAMHSSGRVIGTSDRLAESAQEIETRHSSRTAACGSARGTVNSFIGKLLINAGLIQARRAPIADWIDSGR